jgi:hypothetical protein
VRVNQSSNVAGMHYRAKFDDGRAHRMDRPTSPPHLKARRRANGGSASHATIGTVDWDNYWDHRGPGDEPGLPCVCIREIFCWCARGDLNSHGLPHWILSRNGYSSPPASSANRVIFRGALRRKPAPDGLRRWDTATKLVQRDSRRGCPGCLLDRVSWRRGGVLRGALAAAGVHPAVRPLALEAAPTAAAETRDHAGPGAALLRSPSRLGLGEPRA